MALGDRPNRPHRARRAESLELAAEQIESRENVEAAEGGVRPMLDDVLEQLPEHCERVPAHARARLELPIVFRSVHAGRALQPNLDAIDAVHTDRFDVHAYPCAAGECYGTGGPVVSGTSHRRLQRGGTLRQSEQRRQRNEQYQHNERDQQWRINQWGLHEWNELNEWYGI